MMKFLIYIALLFPLSGFSQTEEPVIEEPIYDFCDKEPQFPGGMTAMSKWFGENVNYPEVQRCEIGRPNKVYLSFVIEKDGSISNVKVMRSGGEELDKEAIRLLRIMPNWTPGEVAGKKVRANAMMPIVFGLE